MPSKVPSRDSDEHPVDRHLRSLFVHLSELPLPAKLVACVDQLGTGREKREDDGSGTGRG